MTTAPHVTNFDLDGRVAIITGAAKGQGRAAATLFAENGARLALTDIDADALEETADLVRGTGGEVITSLGDIGQPETIDAAATAAVQAFGGIDILHNNAGIVHLMPLEEQTVDQIDRLMRVNCVAQILTIQRVVPEMRKRGAGSIINVSSITALLAFPEMAAYAASKAGVVGLTRAVACEVAPAIRCNAICPGNVDTPMLQAHLEGATEEGRREMIENFTARQLLKRLADPREIAELALFLASDRSSFMTGQIVSIDGGWTAW
jgi:NAD(P)-dependent dehydrogenase (short-subunit alcohol dehydrogenase family)